MVVGMGFVYVFLSLLIIVIKTVIAPLAVRFPDPVPKVSNHQNKVSTENKDSIVAAISAAVTQYRKDRE